MNSEAIVSGGCQCGAIRYQVDGALQGPELCHCRMCQKAHGAPAAAWASVQVSGLRWSRGTPARFESSDSAVRLFCAQCGTPMIFQRVGADTLDIALATLDRPQEVAPQSQIGVESRMPWFETAHLLREERTEGRFRSRQHPDHDTDHWP